MLNAFSNLHYTIMILWLKTTDVQSFNLKKTKRFHKDNAKLTKGKSEPSLVQLDQSYYNSWLAVNPSYVACYLTRRTDFNCFVISPQTVGTCVFSASNQCLGGSGRSFGDGASLNRAPAYTQLAVASWDPLTDLRRTWLFPSEQGRLDFLLQFGVLWSTGKAEWSTSYDSNSGNCSWLSRSKDWLSE